MSPCKQSRQSRWSRGSRQTIVNHHTQSKNFGAAPCCGMVQNPHVWLQKTGAAACCGCTCFAAAATMWVLLRAVQPVLSPNDHRNPSQGGEKGFQMPLNDLNNSTFRAFEEPWRRLHGPSGHYVGWVETNSKVGSSDQSLGCGKIVMQRTILLVNTYIHGIFLGLCAAACLRLHKRSAVALKYPCCHQTITQTHPRGNRRALGNVEFSKIFRRRMLARKRPSPHRQGPLAGGGGGRIPGLQTRDPARGLGVCANEKKLFRTRVQIHIQQAQYTKKILPPPPPKKVVPGYGGVEGSKSKNLLWDHFVSQNDDFTRG